MIGPEEFRFLNETGRVAAGGWDDPALSKLWRYNLHYFDDLLAEGARDRASWHEALIERWIRENPPGVGTGWEPYPTSLRIVNWISWVLSGGELSRDAVASLAVQTRWLEERIEHHILGNHLFANAKALAFAGTFFDGPEATRWIATGLELLARECREQFLEDGGHFERSPMYHAILLVDLLDLHNLGCAMRGATLIPDSMVERLPGALAWLRAMTHPDGEIAFFNDAAIGIAPAPSRIEAYASALGIPLRVRRADVVELRQSGYARVESEAAVLLIDMAPVGPDYLPAHAHADTLSFELSVHGQRVVVNGGTSQYGVGPERARQRGTAAHSTVEIDRMDSSEVWAGFRVGRRARPRDTSVVSNPAGDVRISAAHDGYRHLRGRPEHHRTWEFSRTNRTLTVEDRIVGRFRTATARVHLHPSVWATPSSDPSRWVLVADSVDLGSISFRGGDVALEPGTWNPEFGRSVANKHFAVRFSGDRLTTRLTW